METMKMAPGTTSGPQFLLPIQRQFYFNIILCNHWHLKSISGKHVAFYISVGFQPIQRDAKLNITSCQLSLNTSTIFHIFIWHSCKGIQLMLDYSQGPFLRHCSACRCTQEEKTPTSISSLSETQRVILFNVNPWRKERRGLQTVPTWAGCSSNFWGCQLYLLVARRWRCFINYST